MKKAAALLHRRFLHGNDMRIIAASARHVKHIRSGVAEIVKARYNEGQARIRVSKKLFEKAE